MQIKKLCLVLTMAALLPAVAQETKNGASVQVTAYGGSTFKLPGARAVLATPTGLVDSGERNTLPTVGVELGAWFNPWLGTYTDLAFIDGGKAQASLGSNSAEAEGKAFTFLGGFRVRPPRRSRVVPYANVGGGLFHQSGSASTRLGSLRQDGNLSGNFSAFNYGGGLMLYLGSRWGLRPAVDGYYLSSFQQGGGSINFARFTVGIFYERAK